MKVRVSVRQQKSSWGKVRFGEEPRSSALPVSVVAGVGLSVLLSAATASWGNYPIWWQNFLIFFIALLPIAIPVMWVVLVDRSTIKGAVPNPEQSIESVWVSQAAAATFFISLGATGISSAIATIFFDGPVGTILMWVGVALMALFAISYVVVKNKA